MRPDPRDARVGGPTSTRAWRRGRPAPSPCRRRATPGSPLPQAGSSRSPRARPSDRTRARRTPSSRAQAIAAAARRHGCGVGPQEGASLSMCGPAPAARWIGNCSRTLRKSALRGGAEVRDRQCAVANALAELRAPVAHLEVSTPLGAGHLEVYSRARARLLELDPAEATLVAIVRKHVDNAGAGPRAGSVPAAKVRAEVPRRLDDGARQRRSDHPGPAAQG
jgi:hypothetical protein